MRKPTDITVKVLDLVPLNESVKDNLEQIFKTSISHVVNNGPWGIIETNKGIFAINHCGYFTGNTISEDEQTNPIPVEFFAFFSVDEFIPTSAANTCITLSEVKQYSIKEEVYLQDFIKDFGPVVEKQYLKIVGFFSKMEEITEETTANKIAMPAKQLNKKLGITTPPEDTVYVETKESLLKFGSFLTKTICECEKPEVLVGVFANLCVCKLKEQHTHCKHCGGIISRK